MKNTMINIKTYNNYLLLKLMTLSVFIIVFNISAYAYNDPYKFGIGIGNSFGSGAGLNYNLPLSDELYLHVGAGYDWEMEEFGYAGGLKYFISNRLYLDGQFGIIGFSSISSSAGGRRVEPLYGPSLLVGSILDINDRLGLKFGIGCSININENDILDDWIDRNNNLYLGLDLAMMIRF